MRFSFLQIGKVNEASLEWGGTTYDRKHFFHRPRGLLSSLLSPRVFPLLFCPSPVALTRALFSQCRFFAPDGREYTWRRHGKTKIGIDNLSVRPIPKRALSRGVSGLLT